MTPARIAVFGGVYSNHLALAAALGDARRRGARELYCLGDLGAFGPHPDRVFPLLHEHGVVCIQGNYDNAIGNGLADCQCGYTDPRDNHFARLSYAYTFANTGPANRTWMRELPAQRRLQAHPVPFRSRGGRVPAVSNWRRPMAADVEVQEGHQRSSPDEVTYPSVTTSRNQSRYCSIWLPRGNAGSLTLGS